MNRSLIYALMIALCALASTGCSKKDKPEAASSADQERVTAADAGDSDAGSSGMPGSKEINEAAASLKKAAPVVGAELGNAMKAMGNVVAQSENVTITPVDFRALKEMLPETIAGLARKSPEGQRQMGMSEATAEYSADNSESTLSLKIADTGNMRGMMAGAAAYAMSLDMDKETETGYERNTKFQGFKAHEKMDGDSGELTILVGDRFIVEIHGYNIKAEQLKAAADALPLKKLEGMKDEGIEKAPKQ
jgi:hypothetical protein